MVTKLLNPDGQVPVIEEIANKEYIGRAVIVGRSEDGRRRCQDTDR